jgi:hypothetical protein
VWNKFWDKTTTIIAYMFLPITYPVMLWQEYKSTKKIRKAHQEMERFKHRIK